MKKFIALFLLITVAGCFLFAGCKSDDSGIAPTKPLETETLKPTATAEITSEPTQTPEVTPEIKPTEKPDYSGGIVSENRADVAFYPELDLSLLQAQSGTGITIALQFNATAPFYGIGFHSPTWTKTEGYSVDYYIYEWKKDYYETIDGDPVIEIDTEGWKDGQCAQVVFENGQELPAGEYVLLAQYKSTIAGHNAGVYYMEKDFEWTRAYKNDEIWEGVAIITTVFYSKTPANLYGPISDSGIE